MISFAVLALVVALFEANLLPSEDIHAEVLADGQSTCMVICEVTVVSSSPSATVLEVGLARTSHQPSATTTDPALPASLRLVDRPRRIAEDTSSTGLGRRPCRQYHLSRFATKAGEKSGLALPGGLQDRPVRGEISIGLVGVANQGKLRARLVDATISPVADLTLVSRRSGRDFGDGVVRLGRPGIWRDVRVVEVLLSPWGHEGEDLYVLRHATVSIENMGGHGVNEKILPARAVAPLWDQLYREHIINYDALNLCQLERGDWNRYLVVSRSRFDDQVLQFVQWKTRQGYGAEIVTLEELGYVDPRTDEAIEATKDYILDAYENWPGSLQFVLLVGDIKDSSEGRPGSIWTKKFNNPFYGQGWKFHDQWYAFLEGDDLFPDIVVGRLPDSNADRMDYLLAKTIGYETTPHIDGSWQTNAVMTLKSSINATINAKNLVSDIMSSAGFNVSERFNSQGIPAQIIPVVNQGLSFYNYRGDYCGSTNYSGSFSDTDVQFLTNVHKLGVWTIISCSSASFDYSYDITAELLLRHGFPDQANPKGAIAFIGSQAYTAYPYNNPLDEGLYRAVADGGTAHLGAMFLSGKTYAWYHMPVGFDPNRRDAMMKEYTILGDPSLLIWTKVPQSMNVAADHQVVLVGETTTVNVTVTTGESVPISSALVCLSNGDDVYEFGYTRGSGAIVLPIRPGMPGAIDLTVTKANMRPHFGGLIAGTSIPPKKPEDLTASRGADDDIIIDWSEVEEDVNGSSVTIDRYEVYRSGLPYFDVEQNVPIATTEASLFMDVGAGGDPSENHYYRIVAVLPGDVSSAASEIVGEFDVAAGP